MSSSNPSEYCLNFNFSATVTVMTGEEEKKQSAVPAVKIESISGSSVDRSENSEDEEHKVGHTREVKLKKLKSKLRSRKARKRKSKLSRRHHHKRIATAETQAVVPTSGHAPPFKASPTIDYLAPTRTSSSSTPISAKYIAAGKEGKPVKRNQYAGQKLAVFTSGGDSQGMNSAVRAVIRMGIYVGCKVFVIREGYQGMVDGGTNIQEVNWNFASNIIQCGGTIIGSARCKAFQERKGRLLACKNLILHEITNLVCIGGDGSLTGANLFRNEWPSLVKELVSLNQVDPEASNKYPHINIVGMVGSIDNDFCGTDMTIGADTALLRILEAVDAVAATAQSHQRAFIVEVMGRHCGYLGLVSALGTEADWVFTPEWPAPSNWPDVLCAKMHKERLSGQRTNIVIISEGAKNVDGEKITADDVKNVIKKRLQYDTRVTVLGHVQRGGAPSAFDRLLGCRMGAEAVLALMEMKPETDPCVICLEYNEITRVSLMQCVQAVQSVAKALAEKRFDDAAKLRGPSFQRNLATYRLLSESEPKIEKDDAVGGGHPFNVAVVNVGAPCCGINAAIWSLVRMGTCRNCRVYVVYDSFEGLVEGRFKALNWIDVNGWVMAGGSRIGARKELPEDWESVAKMLTRFKIHSLVLIGGFQAYRAALTMLDLRNKHKAFCIPICVLPATISNNVPGSSFSVGVDTALNEICATIEKIKQSATGTRRRVFIVEVMGGYCGYLATLAALASGADNAYIFEEKFSMDHMREDVRVIAEKMLTGNQRYLITRCEKANENYTADFITKLFTEEGAGLFETKSNTLGHHQQGGSPTAFDRIHGIKLAVRAIEWLVPICKASMTADDVVYTTKPDTVCVIGLLQRQIAFTPVADLRSKTDFEHALPLEQWWLKLRPLLRLLAQHDSTYEVEAVDGDIAESDEKMDKLTILPKILTAIDR